MSITRMLITFGFTLATARAEVIVIDPGGGPGSLLLKQALAAAAPGDVLLLEPGDYEQALFAYVIDKGITLLPASADARIRLGPIQIQDVPAGQTVVLRGFDVHGSNAGSMTLVISELGGTAWIEDCDVTGSYGLPGQFSAPGGEAVVVFQANAIFRHCSFAGGPGGDAVADMQASTGGAALRAVALSNVALYHCTLVGGDFGSGTYLSPGATAAPALTTTYSDVLLSGCALTGGKEAADNDPQPGTSGSAILAKVRTSVRVLESVLLAGAVQGAGTQAPAVDDDGSTVKILAEPARSLVLPSLGQIGQPVTLMLDGEPGDLALILMSNEAGAWPMPTLEGTLALQRGSFGAWVSVGVLPGPDGQLSVPLSSAGLPPGVEAMTLFAQGLFQDAGGGSLGGASAITWIAAGP